MGKIFKKIIKYIVVISVLYFVLRVVEQNLSAAKAYAIKPSPGLVLISFFSMVAFLSAQAFMWHLLLRSAGVQIRIRDSVSCWFLSLPGKYLPGKVGYPLGRVFFHKERGVQPSVVGVCLYLEAIIVGIASVLVVFVSVPAIVNDIPLYLAFISIPVLFFMAHPAVIARVVNPIIRMFKKEPIVIGISYWRLLCLILCFAGVYFLFGGLYYFFILKSLFALQSNDFIFCVAVVSGAGLIGQVFFIFPAGIGVRDGMYAYLTGLVLPAPFPVIAAIIARLLVTFAEILMAFVGYVIAKKNKSY